jgi:hypothetical protein
MSEEYAHDAHCNTIHTAGPEPCPPPRPWDGDSVSDHDRAWDLLREERYQHELTQAELEKAKRQLDGAEAEVALLRGDLERSRQDLEVAEAEVRLLVQRNNDAQRIRPTPKELEKLRKVAGVEHDV